MTRLIVPMKRGMPLLRVHLRDKGLGGGFDEVLVSAPNAVKLAAELTGTPSPGPTADRRR